MSVDFVGNFLTIIRNGVMISKSSVTAPYSKLCFEIAQLLKNEGFIKNVVVDEDATQKKILKISLKYYHGESVIHEITRLSKPGRRYYAGTHYIKPVINGLGMSILTTSQGVISDKEAKTRGIGGEVICSVW